MPAKGYRKPKSTCRIEGCGMVARGLGLCQKHYSRQIRYGDASVRKKMANGEAIDWLISHANHAEEECLTYPFCRMNNGYGSIRFGGRTTVASRAMCEVAHGAPPLPNLEAAHSCGNGHNGCVNPRHLRWATRAENIQDQIEHGNTLRGRRNPHSKLTEADVLQIREMHPAQSHRLIAKHFGVSAGTIQGILKGKIWKWLVQ
jgi:hypothetical protein